MDLYLLGVRSMWKMACEIRKKDKLVCLREHVILESYLRSVEFLLIFLTRTRVCLEFSAFRNRIFRSYVFSGNLYIETSLSFTQ